MITYCDLSDLKKISELQQAELNNNNIGYIKEDYCIPKKIPIETKYSCPDGTPIIQVINLDTTEHYSVVTPYLIKKEEPKFIKYPVSNCASCGAYDYEKQDDYYYCNYCGRRSISE